MNEIDWDKRYIEELADRSYEQSLPPEVYDDGSVNKFGGSTGIDADFNYAETPDIVWEPEYLSDR
jgi:hypothetical protein|tara:strand:- start:159 stop:353 length:195 start_codon:yes stop_codon:yes gene_type:complete